MWTTLLPKQQSLFQQLTPLLSSSNSLSKTVSSCHHLLLLQFLKRDPYHLEFDYPLKYIKITSTWTLSSILRRRGQHRAQTTPIQCQQGDGRSSRTLSLNHLNPLRSRNQQHLLDLRALNVLYRPTHSSQLETLRQEVSPRHHAYGSNHTGLRTYCSWRNKP